MSSRMFLSLSAALVFAAGASRALASDSHSVDVKLTAAMSVGGKQLAAGTYRFSWSGSADKVDVTIEKDHKLVEKATAKLEQRPDLAQNEEVISKASPAGARILEELRPRGERQALVFSGS